MGTVFGRTLCLSTVRDALERNRKTVPRDQSELFWGVLCLCFLFLVENLWYLPVKNHALKTGLQLTSPQKEGFMKE